MSDEHKLDFEDRRLLNEIRIRIVENPFTDSVQRDELSSVSELDTHIKRLGAHELIKLDDTLNSISLPSDAESSTPSLVRVARKGQSVYVSDALRFIAAMLVVFVAVNTFFPVLGALGGPKNSNWESVVSQIRDEFVFLLAVLVVALVASIVSQALLAFARQVFKQKVYDEIMSPNASRLVWTKAAIIESIPFYMFFAILHSLQAEFFISNGGLSPAFSWLVIIFCPLTGGLASCIRFQRKSIYAAALPIRVAVISACLAVTVIVSWQASGGTFATSFNVRMFLSSISMLSGVTLIVVFLWCAEVAWIQRVSPWHA